MRLPAAHRKRCRRFNTPGEAHFLTFSCYRGLPLLSRDRSCSWLAEQLSRALMIHHMHLWAYVFMPEHVHLLVWPAQPAYSISQFLAAVKQPVTARAVKYLRQARPAFLENLLDRQPNGRAHHRFWQRGGGYDRNLTAAEEIWAKIDYMHFNPVKRGLCQQPEDWRWSSACQHRDGRPGDVSLELECLPSRVEFVKKQGIARYDV